MNFSQQRVLFTPLELSGTSWTRWAGSIAIHTLAIAAIVAIPVTIRQATEVNKPYVVSLVDPVLPPPAPPRPRVIFRVAPTPPIPAPKVPKIRFQAPERPPVVKKVVAIKALPSIELPKAPAPANLEPPKIDLRAAVKQGVFPSTAPAARAAPARVVKTGGFGNPDGAKPSASSRGVSAPQVGAFDLASGSSRGAGNESAGGAGGSWKHVSTGGFAGSASIEGGSFGGDPRGQVRSAGFGQYPVTSETQHRVTSPAAPAETPVEITFKPKPSYTPEARQKRIEGEVLVEVLFSATGRIRVLGLDHGLGFGLDEKARDAASQIRFRPGTRGGNPIDVKGVVHIVFELS